MIRIALERTWPDVVDALRGDRGFRRSLAEQLRAVPYDAWFWECTRVSRGAFECFVLDAPELAHTRADPRAFAAQLTAPVNTFSSLGGYATLVAPSVTGSYPHLAAFLRSAPDDQVDSLFEAIGRAIAGWSGPSPPWVSTAGMGVPWLHVRIDSRPKYFRHAAYRSG
jgi:hypothetical protein